MPYINDIMNFLFVSFAVDRKRYATYSKNTSIVVFKIDPWKTNLLRSITASEGSYFLKLCFILGMMIDEASQKVVSLKNIQSVKYIT